MVEMKNVHKILVGKPEHGKIMLEWILGKRSQKIWTGFIWLRIEIGGGLL
jgi:hypothetical protein